MTYIDRKTIDIKISELPFKSNDTLKLIDASRLKIIMPEENPPIDIGSWCYTKRKIGSYGKGNEAGKRLVDNSTLIKHRRKFIIGYSEYLFTEHMLGKKPTSILTNHGIFQLYITWCDLNKPNSFESLDTLRSSYIEYTDHLNEKIKTNRLSINSAGFYQKTVKSVIEFTSNIKNGSFLSGIPTIKRNTAITTHTPPPETEEASRSIRIYTALFEGINDFIVNKKAYPWKLEIPSEELWVFPNKKILATTDMLNQRGSWVNQYNAYNFKDGVINNCNDITPNYENLDQIQKRSITSKIETANKMLTSANNNLYHPSRLTLATLAQQSFIMLFSVNTGMNLCTIIKSIWNNNDFDASKTTQGFKTIKSRANNKETTFLIKSKFYPAFKQYLKLREYILSALNIVDCKLLFFKISKSKNKIMPLGMDFSFNYNKRIKCIFNLELTLGTRDWRSHKSDWLIKNSDIYTTSLILQNSPETVIKSYISGSESQAAEEFSNFYSEFTKKSIIKSTNNTLSTSVGRCKKFNSPKMNIKKNDTIQPDCKKPEGCLFCTQYAIVADNEDVRKLLSLSYIIRESRSLASSDEHFEAIFGKITQRIAHIIKCLKQISDNIKGMIAVIENEIFEEERLSPYWDRKLQLLIDLEVIA